MSTPQRHTEIRTIIRRVSFPSEHDGTKLNARIIYPHDATSPNTTSLPAVVLAHPYGPLGGNNNNNLITELQRYFSSLGYLALALNFRGCGRSGGRTSWTGKPELGDLHTAIKRICTGTWHDTDVAGLPMASEIIICGYSFGAMIAGAIDLAYCCGVPAKLILISYPASVTWFLSAGSSRFYIERLCAIMKPRAVGPPPPILFIYGTCDQFTGSRAYERWLKRIQSSLDAGQTNPMEVKRVEAANHFWFHDEQKVVDLIQHWIHSTGS